MIAAAVGLSEATWFNPLTYLLAVVVVGTRMVALGGLMHEAAHYRVFRSRLLNDVIGELMAFPTTASMAGYRNTHFAHHRELNSEKDPDWTRNFGIDDYEFPMPQYLFLRRVAFYLSGLRDSLADVRSFHDNPETRSIPVWTSRLRLAGLRPSVRLRDRVRILEAASPLLGGSARDGVHGGALYQARLRTLRRAARREY